MKYVIITLLILLSTLRNSHAEQILKHPEFGIDIRVPEGWSIRQTETGYLLGHQTLPGLIIITGHELKTLAEMKSEARMGIEGGGFQLFLAGEPVAYGSRGLKGKFEGTAEAEPARAEAISLLSLQGGGVTFIMITTQAAWTSANEDAIKQLADGVRFYVPQIPRYVQEWRQGLGGKRLENFGGTTSGSGSSSKNTTFTLCANGRFSYEYESSISVMGAGQISKDGGNGKWEVEGEEGVATLYFYFENGREWAYTLEMIERDLIILEGNKYRVYEQRC